MNKLKDTILLKKTQKGEKTLLFKCLYTPSSNFTQKRNNLETKSLQNEIDFQKLDLEKVAANLMEIKKNLEFEAFALKAQYKQQNMELEEKNQKLEIQNRELNLRQLNLEFDEEKITTQMKNQNQKENH
eukprot:gene2703-3899_t